MKDFRGQHRVKLYLENKEKIKQWLSDNPDRAMKECSKDLGLSYLTTRQHIKRIMSEKVVK